jgi:hypothetical protein
MACRAYERLEARGHLDAMQARYGTLRQYLPAFLALPFKAAAGSEPLLAACRTYRDSASGLESQRRFAPSPGCPHEQFPPHRPANRLPDAPVRG